MVLIKFVLLNFDKIYFIQFTNNSKCTSDVHIKFEDKQISIANETNLLGIFIDKNYPVKHIMNILSLN